MNEPTHHQIATYLTNYVLSELVKYVMEDTGCTIEQAMERVYNSPLMQALQDEEGELYVQSPAYLYELMLYLVLVMRNKISTIASTRTNQLFSDELLK